MTTTTHPPGAPLPSGLAHTDPELLKIGDPVLVQGEVLPLRSMRAHSGGGRTLLFDRGRVVRVHLGRTVVVPTAVEEAELR